MMIWVRRRQQTNLVVFAIGSLALLTVLLAIKISSIDQSSTLFPPKTRIKPPRGREIHEDEVHENSNLGNIAPIHQYVFISVQKLRRSVSAENAILTNPIANKNDIRLQLINAILSEKANRPLRYLKDVSPKLEKSAIYDQYHNRISSRGLPRDSLTISKVLESLSTAEIVAIEEMEKGTQLKLRVYLKDGNVAVAKPYRVSRNYQTPLDHFYFSDIERHTSEIAAFHVDRLLEFYRTPPTVGRVLNISRDIIPNILDDFLSTFFVSPAGNVCFRGHCKYYCDTMHAICGRDKHLIEVSMQLLLPTDPFVTWIRMLHPFRRSYSARRIADWEHEPNYCEQNVFPDESFHSRLVLDMVDACIFDFLIGNQDRHHLVKIEDLLNDSTIFHIDQGRAFGRYDRDDQSILAPLNQCCLVRFSTLEKLLELAEDEKTSLGRRLKLSLESDPIRPVLNQQHFQAIDRRVYLALFKVWECVKRIGNISKVVVDDGL